MYARANFSKSGKSGQTYYKLLVESHHVREQVTCILHISAAPLSSFPVHNLLQEDKSLCEAEEYKAAQEMRDTVTV